MPNPAASQQKVLEKLLKGVKHQKAGELEKAQRCYQQALKKDPKHPEALNLLGVTYRQLGFPRRAVDYIERAIRSNPQESSFHTNLAHAHLDLGSEPDVLLAACDGALALDRKEREAWNIKGIALTRLGKFEEADKLFKALIISYQDYIDAYLNYGLLLSQSGKVEQAIDLFNKAIAVAPDNAALHVQRARTRLSAAQFEQSIPELSEALKKFPGNSDVTHEAARLMFSMNESHKGVQLAEAALGADPGNAQKALTLGANYLMNRQLPAALEAMLLARKLEPSDNSTIDWNLSLAYLANGHLKDGWALHKARFDSDTTRAQRRVFDVPAWSGQDLAGKTVLVWSDQGLGDVLRAGTMLPELIAQAGKVIIETHDKALQVLQQSFPEAICRTPMVDHALKATLSDFDFHANITDLVDQLRPDLAAFAKTGHPVYTFDRDRARSFLSSLTGSDDKPVIGISWRSRNLAASRARYYLTAEAVAPLLTSRDAIFVNLQYQVQDEEIAALLSAAPDRFRVLDDLDLFSDLPGAAALTACCDFVVSANTSVADIAGILDVPTIRFGQQEATLLLGEETPPWYPSTIYMHPHTDRSCAEYVPELIGELDRQLADWTPLRRNTRLDL